MKSVAAHRRVRLFAFAVMTALSVGVAAQNLLDFDDWMQRIEDGSLDLQRHIAARDPKAASGAAREMEELYGLMEKFFEKRGSADDAVRWSREGREFAIRAQADMRASRIRASQCARVRTAVAIATSGNLCKPDFPGARHVSALYMQPSRHSR
jgi:hypothetical protein